MATTLSSPDGVTDTPWVPPLAGSETGAVRHATLRRLLLGSQPVPDDCTWPTRWPTRWTTR